jgi:hypothetical protein
MALENLSAILYRSSKGKCFDDVHNFLDHQALKKEKTYGMAHWPLWNNN